MADIAAAMADSELHHHRNPCNANVDIGLALLPLRDTSNALGKKLISRIWGSWLKRTEMETGISMFDLLPGSNHDLMDEEDSRPLSLLLAIKLSEERTKASASGANALRRQCRPETMVKSSWPGKNLSPFVSLSLSFCPLSHCFSLPLGLFLIFTPFSIAPSPSTLSLSL